MTRSGISSCSLRSEVASAAAHEVTGVTARIVHQIILVFRFGWREGAQRLNRRDDRIIPALGFVYEFDECLRVFFLLFIRNEDGGAIRRTDIIPLAIHGCRIMDLEKEIQQVFKRRLRWIVRNLKRLSMARMILVARVLIFAAGISGLGIDDARKFAEQVFHPPEAATSQYGFFSFHR